MINRGPQRSGGPRHFLIVVWNLRASVELDSGQSTEHARCFGVASFAVEQACLFRKAARVFASGFCRVVGTPACTNFCLPFMQYSFMIFLVGLVDHATCPHRMFGSRARMASV